MYKNQIKIFILNILAFTVLSISGILMAAPAALDSVKTLSTGLQPVDTMPKSGFGAALFQSFLALLLVLGIIYLSVWLMRKLINKPVLNHSSVFKSLGDFHLDSKKKLSLVKIADRFFVLGVTEQSINLVTELDSETDGKRILESLENSESAKLNFQKILNQFSGKQK